MDNLIFCLNATVPIFAIILLGRLLRGRNFFSKQTLDGDRQVCRSRYCCPSCCSATSPPGRITEQFNREVLLFQRRRYGTLLFRHLGRARRSFCATRAWSARSHRARSAARRPSSALRLCRICTADAGLVPLMIVASVPLYNIFSVLVLTVTAPDARTADHHGVVRQHAARHHHQPDHPRHSRRSAVFAAVDRLSADGWTSVLSMLGGCATPDGAVEHRRGV